MCCNARDALHLALVRNTSVPVGKIRDVSEAGSMPPSGS